MSEVKFSKEHEWITLEGDVATIGITKHATEMLGDIVFAELPEKGSNVEKDGTAGVVESTKAASDVYTPVSGEVVDTNQAIVDDPSKINEDQLYYCRQRGLSHEEAVSLIVNGFCKQVLQELPMEFAVEAQKLVSISLEGSVG